jgi:wyosine [tRNA(Phe)-imidazoG37] synthetase (radical SAM superfamily)
MNFAKKMLLVPPETLERLKQASVLSQTIDSLNDEMQSVLNKPINDNDKWREYEQLLQRYKTGVSNSKGPMALTLLTDHNDELILPMQREIVQSVGNNRMLTKKCRF